MDTDETGQPSLFMPAAEAAERLGVSRQRVYQLAQAGEIPVVKWGRKLVIPRSAWDEWMRRKSDEAIANWRGRDGGGEL